MTSRYQFKFSGGSREVIGTYGFNPGNVFIVSATSTNPRLGETIEKVEWAQSVSDEAELLDQLKRTYSNLIEFSPL